VQRHYLFCDLIKPGMPILTVIQTLELHGNFRKGQYERTKDTTIILAGANDFVTEMRYGIRDVELAFRDGVLGGVVERYWDDDIRSLCK